MLLHEAGACGKTDCRLVLASLYGHARCQDSRRALIKEALQGLAATGLPWILLGDFKQECLEPPICTVLADGGCSCLDDSFTALPAATRVGGRRRIDFGLCSRQTFAIARNQAPGPADHDVVSWTIPFQLRHIHLSPVRRVLSASSAEALRAFTDLWQAELLESALMNGSTEEAWALLSDAAELALAGDNSVTCHDAVPRSSSWVPASLRPSPKGCLQRESVALRRLRRLGRCLQAFMREPSHPVAVPGRLLNASQWLHQQVEGWRLASFEECTLQDLLEASCLLHSEINRRAAEERHRALTQWQVAIADTKRRAEAMTLDSGDVPRSSDPVTRRALHPNDIIKQARESWSSIWALHCRS